MGLETEYGITVVGSPIEVNPVLASSLVVAARREPDDIRWDYSDEHPLRDARDDLTDPHEPVTAEDLGLTNTVLDNGARFYVDHAHPEYSTPEVTSAHDAVRWDRAGDRIVAEAARQASRSLPEGGTILIHKNNTDGKGAAYGSHENHLVSRSVSFADLVHHLTPHFVTRSLYAGIGRLGTEFNDQDVPFQLSQRADFFEAPVGLETTLRRPIINTRDEPHADPRLWRRLHVITGDATQCETATLLRLGVTDLLLAMLEDDALSAPIRLRDPVASFHASSHDLTGRVPLEREDGRTITSLELQRHLFGEVEAWVQARDVTASQHDVVTRWDEVLTIADEDPRGLDGIVDWATKLALLERYRDRDGLDWDHPRLALVDLQFHDLRPERGLFTRLEASGRVRQLIDEDAVQAARRTPPEDTRAWFRGRMLQEYRAHVVAVGWDAMILDAGRRSYVRIPMADPRRGTRDRVEQLFADSDSIDDLVTRLTS